MHRRRRRRLSVGSNLNQSANHGEATPHKDSREASASLNASYADLGTNDDREERRDLRKSARRSRRKSFVDMVTPKGRTARRRGSSRSRRRSASPGSALKRRDYTNDQLSAIYRDCILKAQTGKITQQNAWNLHLVDNIEQMVSLNANAVNSNVVQPQKSSQQNEFAKASHTIDAASKIYGYRVDSVHNKMYTVLNSIHQQGGDGGEGGGDGDELAAEQNRKRKARNRSLGKSTLCEADKLFKINESVKNLCVEVDPLFHKTASCFDEGGAKGLLMNTLYVQNGVDIVFDSSTKIEQNTLMALNTEEEEAEADDGEESAWMSQLCTESFGEKLVSGMESSVDSTNFSQPMEMACTQADPQHFTVDLDWMDSTAMCPLLELFQNHIDHLNGTAKKPNTQSTLNAHNSMHSLKQQPSLHDASPEKNLNQSGMVALHDDGMDFGGDDDVLMDMPDFTLGGDVSMNAQDLFHEELLTQAVVGSHAQNQLNPNVVQLDRSMGGMSMNMQLADVDPNNLSSAALDASYVVGHANAEIRVGNMGVQPLMNSSWIRDDAVVLEKLKQEQQQMPGLHKQGIYKEGAMNLNAMNDVIAKLEKADFESLTSFFDTKKHGNWAGPDQWYHRRYQLTLNKQKRVGQRSNTSANASVSTSPSANAKETKAKRARKKKESSQFDFMSIAAGAFVDDARFEAPQRSFNTLTQAVLDKNRKVYHTLPKDLQIKPDMFIKLFHRPNYSVWKHWLNQHKLRMLKRNEDQRAKLNGSNVEVGVGNFADEMGLGDDEMHHSMLGDGMAMAMGDGQTALMAQNALAEQNVVAMENIEVMGNMAQFAAMAQNGGADEDEFQHNYQDPLDASDLKGEFGGELALEADQFDFNEVLNGYDLIDDPNRKVDKIRVQYAVSAKKVNVRKLKLKLWDRIDVDLKKKDVQSEDEDVDMGSMVKEKEKKGTGKVTFQDSLDTLPVNISSSISIHMCFICLLHLANEKELQFVPKKLKMDGEESGMMPVRGDFEIQYADASSAMEMDATKINPVMVLGMQ